MSRAATTEVQMGDRARLAVWGAQPLKALMGRVAPVPLVLVSLVAGCSQRELPATETVPSTWEPVSGSRLSARFLLGENGLRVFDGWFDNDRGEPCRVARGQGGRYYCFPAANAAVFSDARCQQPLGQHLECAFRYTGVVRGDRRCGNDTLTLWQEGEPVLSGSRFRLTNDFCSGPDTTEGGVFVGLTGRVPENTLVSGEPYLARASLRLGPRVIRFEDGSTAPFEMYDNSQNRACVRMQTVRGVRCLPETAVFVGPTGPYWADETCSTQRVAHVDAPACLRPAVALVTEVVDGCTLVREAYRPGERLDPRTVFSGGDCQGGRLIPGHFYQLGAPVSLETFPELSLREVGSGRIRVRSYSANDAVSISPLGQFLFDAQLGIECKVAVAEDGVLRCLPLSGPSVVEGEAGGAAFADAGCRRPLARYNPAGTCRSAMPAMAGVARASHKRCLDATATGPGSRDDRRPGRWEIHRLGKRHEGEVFFGGDGSCQPGPGAAGDEFYEMEETLPPDTFAPLREE
jgi:hypothetical protein